MNLLNFDNLMHKVFSWWPREIAGQEDDFIDPMQSPSIERIYEREIQPISANCGSRLGIQLDWIIYSLLHEVSRKVLIVRPHEIRVDIIRARFHKLLREDAILQLNGKKEWDGSFDKAELELYIKSENIYK